MEAIQAIPTRYKGVEYRSRSEARFAAFLHYSGFSFVYEPDFLKLPNLYVPDFAMTFPLHVIPEEDRIFNIGFPLNLTVIEYKPKIPNEEYLNSLRSNFMQIANRVLDFGISQFQMWLAIGTVYDERTDRKILGYYESDFSDGFAYGTEANWDELLGWDERGPHAIEYAKTYR